MTTNGREINGIDYKRTRDLSVSVTHTDRLFLEFLNKIIDHRSNKHQLLLLLQSLQATYGREKSATMNEKCYENHERVILHLDLDAFYVAAEREINPLLLDKAVAVSQYNPYGTLEPKTSEDIEKRLVVSAGKYSNNDDANGSLIAVSYEARAQGVKRNDRGLEAIQKCPELFIVQVPVKHGKADLTLYRNTSRRIMQFVEISIQEECLTILQEKQPNIPVQVASIDEVYLDLSKPAQAMVQLLQQDDCAQFNNEFWKRIVRQASSCTTIGGVEVLSEAAQANNALDKDELRKGSALQVLDSCITDFGSKTWWNRPSSSWTQVELLLACGSYLAAQARLAITQRFGVFTLSGGISSNKTLAKLASGMKKPNRQTLINGQDASTLAKLYSPLPLGRIKGLGGKMGNHIGSYLQIQTVGQLSKVPFQDLMVATQGDTKMAKFLYDISRGNCNDAVTPQTKPKSIACGKTFRGPLAISISDIAKQEKWLGELCKELKERLSADRDEHRRTASTLMVGIHIRNHHSSKQSRAPKRLEEYKEAAWELLQFLVEGAKSRHPDIDSSASSMTITGMSITATQFVDITAESATIQAAFQRLAAKAGKEKSTTLTRDAVAKGRTNASKNNKRSIMDCWNNVIGAEVTPKDNKVSPSGSSSNHPTTVIAKKQQFRAGEFFFRHHPSDRTLDPTSNSVAAEVALPTIDEVDPEFLAELPEEIRVSLMKDIQNQKSLPSKTSIKPGIDQFFCPRSK